MVNKTEKSKYRPFLPLGHPIKSSKMKQVENRRTTYSPTKTAAVANMEKHKEESSPSEVIMLTVSVCFHCPSSICVYRVKSEVLSGVELLGL